MSFLDRTVQIGSLTVPLPLVFLFLICFGIVMILNIVYLRRYQRIMGYLERHHPETYEQVRRKPEIGPLYSKTYNPSKPLIRLAKQSPELNDPALDQMLADFVIFDRRFVWFSSITIVIMMLLFLVVGVILSL